MPITAVKPDHAAAGENAKLLARAERLIERIERLLPVENDSIDWQASPAFRWRKRAGFGCIEPIKHLHRIALDDLRGIDAQKNIVVQNTLQFVRGHPANNVLLTGARGSGKSSLVKALLHEYAQQNLRVIEVEKRDLIDLHEIVALVYQRPEKFVVFCDDLSFADDEPGYKALKVVLDGSLASASANVLIYATSNRRHLMPEYLRENAETKHQDEEIHFGEAVEEKISLSERFGLWVSFYSFDQTRYLEIAAHWLATYGFELNGAAREAALQWALGRGSRSGRVAWQFARDWAGKHAD